MNLQIGKRYSFSPWCGAYLKPGKHYHDGILESIDDHWAYLVCRNGENWMIPKEDVLPYQKKFKK